MNEQAPLYSGDPAPILAMVSVAEFDRGVRMGQRTGITVAAVTLISLLASRGMDQAPAGWFVTLMAFASLLMMQLFFVFVRMGLTRISRRLQEQFGLARFTLARPMVDRAMSYIKES